MEQQGDKRVIMVVDDDPSILFTVETILEYADVNVIKAENGYSCLDQLEAGFRGVILMDIMMPEMDGWDTIREILSRGLMEGNVISMITAKDVPDKKMEGLEEYVIDYIMKPFEPERLTSAVDQYLSYVEKP
ncbi:MAG: response regulator [Chloroflexota bacterium]|nr:response regulator [Chloroflexota bacterium]